MFKPVSNIIDYPYQERKIFKYWYEKGIVKAYLKKNNKSSKNFSFLDGPITANNPMGVHHAWGRTYKDLWQRYFTMRGFKQRYQNGFDCQGLWVEVEVEKELGFKKKSDIAKYGIDRFVNKCKQRVLKYAKIQTEQSKRLGYFMDWENSYYTMSDENNYMIWFFLKKVWQNNWLYKGRDSVPWCPRCGTAISQHEILTEDYRELTHRSIYYRLPINELKNTYFLVWTTTPWTIPGNISLAISKNFYYVLTEQKKTGDKYIFFSHDKDKNKYFEKIKKDAGLDNLVVKKVFRGSDLIDKYSYFGPYDHLPAVKEAKKQGKKFHNVIEASDLVNPEEGTGIVHIAPSAGQEDYTLAKLNDLAIVEIIDEKADYLDNLGNLSKRNAKVNPEIILNDLDKRDFAVKIYDYTHRYPICWRCKTELVWRVVDEWYISMDRPTILDSETNANKTSGSKTLRKRIIKVAKRIRWLPEFGLDREMDWLNNMHDWLISKKRYWGLALPVWECTKCGHFEVIGSKEELRTRAIVGWESFKDHTPHKPWIDKVKIKCVHCGEITKRIPDVGNPWLDAGIVAYSTLINPKTKKLSYLTGKKYWSEWFPADFITESFPGQFKNWFYSLLAMSTVLEDKPPFKTVLGHAQVRDEQGREMHKSLGNAIWFDEGVEKIGADVMRWMYVRQNPFNNLHFGYKVADETRRKFHLILWNVYRFFITYANIHNWRKKNSQLNLMVLDKWILMRLAQTIKIVTTSLNDYNVLPASESIENFVSDLSAWYVRRSRNRIASYVKDTKDKDAFFSTCFTVLRDLMLVLAPFTPFMTEEIFQNLAGEKSVHLCNWPDKWLNYHVDKTIIERMQRVRKICEMGHSERKRLKIKVRQVLSEMVVYGFGRHDFSEEFTQLIKDELNIKKIKFIKTKAELKIKLNTKLSHNLLLEGHIRELIRKIQDLRKREGYGLREPITLYCLPPPKKYLKELMERTLAKNVISSSKIRIERYKK